MTEEKTYNAESLERYKRKIAQLLAMANDSSATEHERDSFMAKAQELMQKYQLEMKDITGAEDLMSRQKGEQGIYTANMWAKYLVHNVAKLYGCRALFGSKIRNLVPYELYGRESARVTTEMMLPFIVKQIRQQARILVKEQGFTQSIAEREVAFAVVTRIRKMLEEENRDRETALTEADAFMRGVTIVVPGKGKVKSGYSGAAAEAAGNVSLHRQTGGPSGKPLMIGRGF